MVDSLMHLLFFFVFVGISKQLTIAFKLPVAIDLLNVARYNVCRHIPARSTTIRFNRSDSIVWRTAILCATDFQCGVKLPCPVKKANWQYCCSTVCNIMLYYV